LAHLGKREEAMRTLAMVAGGLLAIGVSMTCRAQEAPVWQGFLFVTSATSTCTTDEVTAVDDYYTSVYRPNIAPPPTNQAKAALSISFGRGIALLEAPGSTLRGSVNATSTLIGSRAELFTTSSPVDLKITPAKITASTPVVQISGTIANFLNGTSCNVAVNGVFGLRP
jgi:hypothetical protein